MSGYGYAIGLPKREIDTPALLIDLDTMEHNLNWMAAHFRNRGARLRPHVKLHKATPVLAHKQLQAGAVGVTYAKLAEAEIMAASGIKDILIANQIVGDIKIRRLVNLAAHADVMVVVDNADNFADLSQAAQAKGAQLRVLVEVNIGHNRCGVAPFEPALVLSCMVCAAPGLKFIGLMTYDGHCTIKVDPAEREAKSLEASGFDGFLSIELGWDYTLDPLPAVIQAASRMRDMLNGRDLSR